MMADFSFLHPWLLVAFIVLPLLWWILRAFPPLPRTFPFPAFFLLERLKTNEKTPAHTPWWLLLLRVLCAALFILAFAHPVLQGSENAPSKTGDLMIAIDNGWAAANNWPARQDRAGEILAEAKRHQRNVIMLATAATKHGAADVQGPMSPNAAQDWLRALKPYPWLADEEAVKAALTKENPSEIIYLHDGVSNVAAISSAADLVISDNETNSAYLLRREGLERLATAKPASVRLLALAADGSILDVKNISFLPGESEAALKWDMTPEMRKQVARMSIEGAGAGGAYLFNRVGNGRTIIVNSDKDPGLLSEAYYPARALPDALVAVDVATALKDEALSTLILPDEAVVNSENQMALKNWVEKGGLLIRFAGARLAVHADDPLLPVDLRGGGRATEGAMTWEKPLHLGETPKESPFYGLKVPEDVTVTRQVLARPAPETFSRTWLALEDGTPLVTGAAMGQGSIVLVHTTAGPSWSDFCYSGFYVEMLQRLSSLGKGAGSYQGRADLPAMMVMDGFGRLSAVERNAGIAPVSAAMSFDPSPHMPPGLYGDAAGAAAFNLGDALPHLYPASLPATTKVAPYAHNFARDLQTSLLLAAIFLLMMDAAVAVRLQGSFSLIVVAMLISSAPAQAADSDARGLYLAYIETGDGEMDRLSYNGLSGLARAINTRTAAQVLGVRGLNPAQDELNLYPLIYWPMSERQTGLSLSALKNIQDYLERGGIIFFDTRDARFDEGPGTRSLRAVTQELQLPELMLMPKDHILTRSFYLLNETPGRFTSNSLWVEKEPDPAHDNVASVIIGSNDWASAWSLDENDRLRYPIEPGGETQREAALHFGINLAMVALTGNYKSDQVHVPFILERIGK